ncbi:MAG TPA: putative Ig domain-containing protein [Actinocrinis sp.]|uniref:beta strand repeat-containing protein n=1 Tax=Actinocrinis sp. TaxID=1920516 RepID=UPI002DDD28FB|nr:putative Ig domain-containing protein [Actinocrinis sp.]HEV2344102.1 putative Ig domain-containing protein [Actinocrinis sp.]
MRPLRRGTAALTVGLLLAGLTGTTAASPAAAMTSQTLDLKVLLVGEGSSDPGTQAWQEVLTSEGVPFTLVQASGGLGGQTVALPTLSSGATGDYNGVVLAGSPYDFAAGQLSALFAYESSFNVRQIDGYMYPSTAMGLTPVGGGALDGTTAGLTPAGLAAFPGLAGTVSFDAGTYGYTASLVAGAPVTALLENSAGAGGVLAAVYQHPGMGGDPQAGVSELSLLFDYNQYQLQWLILAPQLIDWVTQNTHLGLFRNYFGQDIDDVFIADNEWSSRYQCTPAASDPLDVTCPAGVAGNPADEPPDTQMSAADVDYVANWEQNTGVKLELAFNAVGACTSATAAGTSSANCSGSYASNGTTYADPGHVIGSGYPDDGALVNELLKDQADFAWITHTWSHLFLGCLVWQPLPVGPATAGAGGTLAAGTYTYEVTATTAYGESEPSTPQTVAVGANGTATLSWADATNGGGPGLTTLEGQFHGGTGFWGYSVYRKNPGSTTFGLVGRVAQDPAGATSSYSFTDTGVTAPGSAPSTTAAYPTATDPGIECAGSNGADWVPAASASPDSSVGQEIGLDVAFAQANGLTGYSPNALVTGEHSGLENPNMPTAFAGLGITTFAADGSRQPAQYTLNSGSNTAYSSPRYPSNIYYNADNWPDEINEYGTLYVANGTNLGNSAYPNETGHCVNTSSTTCTAAVPTEATILVNESRNMFTHILNNDPRVFYAHQSNLIGPATRTANGVTSDYGYTLLSLLNDVLGQYRTWYSAAAPLAEQTTATAAQILRQQAAWTSAVAAGNVTASITGGNVTVNNGGTGAVGVPITVPAGTTVGGTAFGTAYSGQSSAWDELGAGATTTLTENVAPAILSQNSAISNVGTAFSATITATGEPAPAIAESGALPAGLTFTDDGNGTATLAGTPAAGTGGSYPITISASSSAGTTTQAFTLTNTQAPTITSPGTATFYTGQTGTYSLTTTGFPAPSLTESGGLPAGLAFTDNGNGTGSISGITTAAAGTYPVSISATNSSGSTATLNLTITVTASTAPAFTDPASAYFTLNAAGGYAITTTGAPSARLSLTSGTLPTGLTFVDNGNGTGTLAGTATTTGTATLVFTAANPAGTATQTFTLYVGSPPAFTNASSASFTSGAASSFTITTTGYPAPWIGYTGSLPPGITFTNNGNGTATLSGTPTSAGTYSITLDADSSYGSASQGLTITVH